MLESRMRSQVKLAVLAEPKVAVVLAPRLLSRLEDMHLELNCRRFLRPVR